MASRVTPSKEPLPWNERPAPPSEDLEKPEDYKKKFKDRVTPTKMADPCEAASKASLDCLERTSYNRAECFEFFKAYRECKKNWIEQRREDRRNGRAG